MMTATQQAAQIRKALKSVGVETKGLVRVRNLSYETVIQVRVWPNAEIEDAVRDAEVNSTEPWPFTIDW